MLTIPNILELLIPANIVIQHLFVKQVQYNLKSFSGKLIQNSELGTFWKAKLWSMCYSVENIS